MTKTLAGVAAVFCLLLAIPPGAAHGAAAAREIDTRLLADDEGVIPYGGCAEGTCLPGLEAEGLDLVVLEVREAYLDQAPALVFRIVYQTDDAHEGRAIDLLFTAGGADHTYSFTTDGATAPTGTFDKLTGPFEAFDGFPRAVDAYLLYSTLGIEPGDALTDIHLTSNFEGEANDILPGTWFASGQAMPFIPNPEGELTQPDPAAYTLKGPAKLVNMTATPGSTEVTLTVTNPLTAMVQFLSFTGTGVTFDNANLNLEPGATREIKVTITDPATAAVNVSSDLDYFEGLSLASAPAAAPASTSQSLTHSSSHTPSPGSSTLSGSSSPPEHDEGGEHDEGKDTPGLPVAFLVLSLAALAIALRRRV